MSNKPKHSLLVRECHALMTGAKFKCANEVYPLQWPENCSVFRLAYTFNQKDNEVLINLRLVFVSPGAGNEVVVHCFCDGELDLRIDAELSLLGNGIKQFEHICLKPLLARLNAPGYSSPSLIGLPAELKIRIFGFLDDKSIGRLMRVSRMFNELCRLDATWKPIFLQKYRLSASNLVEHLVEVISSGQGHTIGDVCASCTIFAPGEQFSYAAYRHLADIERSERKPRAASPPLWGSFSPAPWFAPRPFGPPMYGPPLFPSSPFGPAGPFIGHPVTPFGFPQRLHPMGFFF